MSGEQRLKRQLSTFEERVDAWDGPRIHPDCFMHFDRRELGVFLYLREEVANGNLVVEMRTVSNCGVACCYGGHMAAILFSDYNDKPYFSLPIIEMWNAWYRNKVFRFPELSYLFAGINPNDSKELLRALDNYLLTGKGAWPCTHERFLKLLQDQGAPEDIIVVIRQYPCIAYHVHSGNRPISTISFDWLFGVLSGDGERIDTGMAFMPSLVY